jgi:hypothetical protein
MQGVITSKDILRHLPLILREFGPRCAVRALRAVLTRERTTFLDVACGAEGELPQPPVTGFRRIWRS